MAITKDGRRSSADEILESRKAMWNSFVRWSTWVIVFAAIILVGMALFLL